MKTSWKTLILIAAASAAGPAHAIPVTFDFAGTLRETTDWDTVNNTQALDLSRAGTAFTARFIVDTEMFAAPQLFSNELAQRRSFSSLAPGALTVELIVGGEIWSASPYPSNSSLISVGDSLGRVCNPVCRYSPDQFAMSTLSEEVGALGAENRRSISVGFSALGRPQDEYFGTGWFDFDEVATIDQVMSLPLIDLNPLSFIMQDYRITCGESCLTTGIVRTTFDVTSLTRTVASVPEPGTLALLGAGLAMAFTLRRRRRATA